MDENYLYNCFAHTGEVREITRTWLRFGPFQWVLFDCCPESVIISRVFNGCVRSHVC